MWTAIFHFEDSQKSPTADTLDSTEIQGHYLGWRHGIQFFQTMTPNRFGRLILQKAWHEMVIDIASEAATQAASSSCELP